MTKLAELKERHKELRSQIVEESKAWFSEQSKALFAKHPKMQSFSWRQYTPYFNDGDECEFSAHTDDPNINGESEWDGENRNSREWMAIHEDVTELLKAIDEESLKEMFGDHCEVIATRDGAVNVEEYSHD
jgi:hypothetical protein